MELLAGGIVFETNDKWKNISEMFNAPGLNESWRVQCQLSYELLFICHAVSFAILSD